MKIVFVIGPYGAATHTEIDNNINKAKNAAKLLWKKGYAVICPHTNSAFFGGVVPEDKFINGYLEILSRCDAVCCLEGWENSAGSLGERKLALKLNMKFITIN